MIDLGPLMIRRWLENWESLFDPLGKLESSCPVRKKLQCLHYNSAPVVIQHLVMLRSSMGLKRVREAGQRVRPCDGIAATSKGSLYEMEPNSQPKQELVERRSRS